RRYECGRRFRRLPAPETGGRRHPAATAYDPRRRVRPAGHQVSDGVTRRRRKSYSLRTRVAGAAAAGSVLIVALVSAIAVPAIERNNLQQTDQQLRIASRLVVIDPVIAVGIVNLVGPDRDMALTVRDDGPVVASSVTRLPELDPGSRTVTVDDTPYRVLTTTENQPTGRTVSLGIPATDAAQATADQQRWLLFAGLAAIAASAALGWLFGGRAVRPILARTRQVGGRAGVRDAAP